MHDEQVEVLVDAATTSSGASESVTVMPGPVRGVRPAGSSSFSIRRWKRWTSRSFTEFVRTAMSALRSVTRSRSAAYSNSLLTSDERSV